MAADLTPPVVATPIPDLTVSVGAAPTVIKLKKTFALQGVTGQVVRFDTVLGSMDVELDATDAPLTTANFLNYVARPAYDPTVTPVQPNSTSGAEQATCNYDGSLIHRSVNETGLDIVQGGGFFYATKTNIAPSGEPPGIYTGQYIYGISPAAPVTNEFKVSNTRGTIAMALAAHSPNSATTEWFFNVQDNSAALDPQLFTVFGRVIEGGLATMDALAAVPVPNPSPFSSPLDSAPLINYTSGAVEANNLVLINSVAVIPLVPSAKNSTALLKLKATSSNPGLVQAVVTGRHVTLTFLGNTAGTATITVQAKDAAKTKVTTSFNVTVQ